MKIKETNPVIKHLYPIGNAYPNTDTLEKYRKIIEVANLDCSEKELFLYLKYGDMQLATENSSELDIYSVNTSTCLWHLNKGDLRYLEGDAHFYYLLNLYTKYVSKENFPESLLVAKFNKPIVTSDKIKYFSVGNYYSAMMSGKYEVRKYIASLSPFSALKYWQSETLDRDDWLNIREKVMHRAMSWLLTKDNSIDVLNMPLITGFFYKSFPLFGSEEENKFWGVYVNNANTKEWFGYNRLGSLISQILYNYKYEDIPF